MAWVRRRRGGPYYTRSRWVDGRTVVEYVGRGPAARAAADLDRMRRLERQAAGRADDDWTRQAASASGPARELGAWLGALAFSSWLLAGYHRHRGVWRRRRRRGAAGASGEGGGEGMSDTIRMGAVGPDELAELQALAARADGGDADALAALRAFLGDNPQLWRRLGDLAAHAEAAWVGLIAGTCRLASESVRLEADRVRGEVLEGGGGPLERLLADQVVSTLLELRHHELRAAASGGLPAGRAAALAKRTDGAQRRHLAAVKALAELRRLGATAGASPRLRVVGAGD